MKIEKGKNRHSFTLESNGYRLIFLENSPQYKGQPYCQRFGIVSIGPDGEYARIGIGKMEKNNANSFADAVEKQMVEIENRKDSLKKDMEELQRKFDAMTEFGEVLPKLFLENGVGDDDDGKKKKKRER